MMTLLFGRFLFLVYCVVCVSISLNGIISYSDVTSSLSSIKWRLKNYVLLTYRLWRIFQACVLHWEPYWTPFII